MKRDPSFAAAVPPVRHTAPTRHLHAAVRALAKQEHNAAELAEAVERAHPTSQVNILGILRRGFEEELITSDDAGMVGLTDAGHTMAERLRAEQGIAAPVHRSEHERRVAALADGQDPHDLTRGQVHATSSAADNRPQPMRAGTNAALALPSRMGDRLHYRDGRITDLQGNALTQARGA